jgi:hypothetical protein
MRRAMRVVGAVVAVGLFVQSTAVRAEDQKAVPSQVAAPHLNLEPIAEGAPSPVSGVVMDNETFMLYLREHVALEEANLRIQVRDKLLQQEAAAAQRSWMERNGFYVGLVLGLVASMGIIYGARQTIVK